MYVFWSNSILKLGHLVQEQPFCHCASTALTVSVSCPLYGPRQPVCCLFASSIGRLYLFCVYLLLVSQRELGRMNCEFIPGRGVKPVRMDTPPGCRLIVFFLSCKAAIFSIIKFSTFVYCCARRCCHVSSCGGPCKGRKIIRRRQGLRRSRGLPRTWENENQCLSCSIYRVRRRAGLR